MSARPPCEACGVPLVPSGHPVPAGMRRHGARGLCQACAARKARGAEEALFQRGPVDWQDSALCAQADPEEWYPELGGQHRRAKVICGRCPVRQPCLDDAIATDDVYHGIRGGLAPRHRQRLRDAS